MKERPTDLAIERLALGELAPADAAKVRAALGDEAEAKLAALADEDAEILRDTPPAAFAAEVRRRLARTQPEPQRVAIRWWVPSLTLLAAGALAWWWSRVPETQREAVAGGEVPVRSHADDRGEELPESVRIKGEATMTIDRLGARGPEPVRDGDMAMTGDRLQVQYRAGDREQGVIVSIDGRGVATLHFPADVTASPELRTGGTIALDHSYELDDAPAFERFFFVTVEPGLRMHVDRVLDAARALASSPDAAAGSLALPRGYEQRVISLRKRDAVR